MLTVILLSSLLLILLLGLLFSPLVIRVNTQQNLYQLSWGLARVQLIPTDNGGYFLFRYTFWQWEFPLLKLLAKPSSPKKTEAKVKTARKKGTVFFSIRRLRRVMYTFKLRFFYLDVDTDDFVYNAYWYPVFSVFSTPTRKLSINFSGRNQCAFELRNRVYDVLIALIF